MKGPARIGLSVDEEKSEEVRHESYREVEASIPDCVPRLLARGNNKVAFDILKLLGEGAKRPKELRAALGIASVNFFTARYLTPLVEDGYIAPEDNASANSPNRKYKLTQKGIMMV